MLKSVSNSFWIPTYISIHGNNKGDRPANFSLQFEVVKLTILYTDLKCSLKFYPNPLCQYFLGLL